MIVRFVATALAAVFFGPLAALAGGCSLSHAVECYDKVSRPDEYQTVARSVVVAPARSEIVRSAAVVETRLDKVQTQPARVTAHHVPAQWGHVERTVVVRPASVSYRTVPAEYHTALEHVVVQAESWRWEKQLDRHGRETLCKVHVPAVTRTIERRHLVSPARQIAHTTPTEYGTVSERVLVAPARVAHSVQPATYAMVERQVVVRPAHEHVVHHPAVMGVAHQQVLVRRGGHDWQPAGHRWGW